MTSEQVMLALLALLLPLTGGCSLFHMGPEPAPRLTSPYAHRQVWAVAPLRNESGSGQVDGARIADHLARQLERVGGIEVLPVNRVLAAMDALRMSAITSPKEAMKLRQTLGVDGLVVGTVSAYDPYDPPKLGLALELYLDPQQKQGPPLNLRRLQSAAVGNATEETPSEPPASGQPTATVSAFFDAADPATRLRLRQYAAKRGETVPDDQWMEWRKYRLSMDLYTEFVSYAASSKLLAAEYQRLGVARPAAKPKPVF